MSVSVLASAKREAGSRSETPLGGVARSVVSCCLTVIETVESI
jgi:hypothetical protein